MNEQTNINKQIKNRMLIWTTLTLNVRIERFYFILAEVCLLYILLLKVSVMAVAVCEE